MVPINSIHAPILLFAYLLYLLIQIENQLQSRFVTSEIYVRFFVNSNTFYLVQMKLLKIMFLFVLHAPSLAVQFLRSGIYQRNCLLYPKAIQINQSQFGCKLQL
ncbi:MAG TPA: hypothetical protein DDW62_02720 [Marinilabiliaceae bacterium]|nr:hypothetical protein [Marinilabiliaceae bacterium]